MSRDNLDQSNESVSCIAISSSGTPFCRRSRTALANASLSTSAILANDPATTRMAGSASGYSSIHPVFPAFSLALAPFRGLPHEMSILYSNFNQ